MDTRLQILSSGSGSGRECQRKRGREARRSRGGWIRERVSASASASPNPRGGGGGIRAADVTAEERVRAISRATVRACVRVLYSRSAALYLSTERRAADDETRQRCGGGGGGGGGGALCRGVSGRRTPPPRSPQQRQLYLQNRPRQPASCAAAIGCSAMASQRVSGAYGGGCNSFFFFFFFISFSGVPSRQFSLVSNRRTAYVCVRSM